VRTSSPFAVRKAAITDRWTEILFRALANRVAQRWRFVSFRGIAGGEWRGIVDLVAIRKDTSHSDHELLKRGDLFEIILIQMKGGSAQWPTEAEVRRLRAVRARYRAKAVVLFCWKKGHRCDFYRLAHTGQWKLSSSRAIFG
jgi:hypothetical protein